MVFFDYRIDGLPKGTIRIRGDVETLLSQYELRTQARTIRVNYSQSSKNRRRIMMTPIGEDIELAKLPPKPRPWYRMPKRPQGIMLEHACQHRVELKSGDCEYTIYLRGMPPG